MLQPNLDWRYSVPFLVGLLLPTAGCVDYTNRFDSVNIHAGDAPAANAAIQTINPWPPEAERTYIDASGRKVIIAVDDYTKPKPVQSGTTNITINN